MSFRYNKVGSRDIPNNRSGKIFVPSDVADDAKSLGNGMKSSLVDFEVYVEDTIHRVIDVMHRIYVDRYGRVAYNKLKLPKIPDLWRAFDSDLQASQQKLFRRVVARYNALVAILIPENTEDFVIDILNHDPYQIANVLVDTCERLFSKYDPIKYDTIEDSSDSSSDSSEEEESEEESSDNESSEDDSEEEDSSDHESEDDYADGKPSVNADNSSGNEDDTQTEINIKIDIPIVVEPDEDEDCISDEYSREEDPRLLNISSTSRGYNIFASWR